MGQCQTNTILLSQIWRCVVVFLVLVCVGCGTSSNEAGTASDNAGDNLGAGIRVAFPRQDSSESNSHGVLSLTVTGPGIDTPVSVQQSFDLLAQSVVIELPAVPVGNDRVFTVEAFPEDSSSPNFLGETMANIPSSGADITVVMVPNVQGLYSVSGSETLMGCSDEEDSGTFGVSGTINIASQNGTVFSGSTSFSAPFLSEGVIDGTVTADGEVSGTFDTIESDGTESEGTFSGAIVDGQLTITFSGMDTFLDTCIFEGEISGIVASGVPRSRLYGSDPVGAQLLTLDSSTGLATAVGPFTGAAGQVTEIEWSPDGSTLFATTGGGSSAIHTIDPSTGAVLSTVEHPFGALNGMEFDSNGDLLAAFIPNSGQPSELVRVDPITGALTTLGATGFGPIGGLVFDSGFETLFGITSGRGVPPVLLSIDPVTGLATPIATTDLSVEVSSLEFTTDGRLVTGGNDGNFYELNPVTGISTLIGPMGVAKVSGLSVAPSAN